LNLQSQPEKPILDDLVLILKKDEEKQKPIHKKTKTAPTPKPEPTKSSIPNPFFGISIKKTKGLHIKDDFNPFTASAEVAAARTIGISHC
jgi:hypothetical protein